MDSDIIPEDILMEANEVTSNLLPVQSRTLYEKEYLEFCKWRESRGVKGTAEPIVLAYFKKKAENYAASSLWTKYSMLRSCLEIKERVKISEYGSLIAFIKQKNVGYEGKKAKVLTRDEINEFLRVASDESFLMIKVAFLFAISGALRGKELAYITIDDIEDKDTLLVVTISKSKTHVKRVFTVISEGNVNAVELYRKYIALRPPNMENRRFFVSFRNGKCTRQVCGEHFFASIPQRIAKFLNLPEAEKYTGHSMRRSSATLLANSGADIMRLKRLGGWKSSKVAESYVEDSIAEKIKTTRNILVDDVSINSGHIVERMTSTKAITLTTSDSTRFGVFDNAAASGSLMAEETMNSTIDTKGMTLCSTKNDPINFNFSNCHVTINMKPGESCT